MGFKVMMRIYGFTGWFDVGYALIKSEAEGLIEDAASRVQIVAFPKGEDLRKIEEKLTQFDNTMYPEGGMKDVYDIRRLYPENKKEDGRNT